MVCVCKAKEYHVKLDEFSALSDKCFKCLNVLNAFLWFVKKAVFVRLLENQTVYGECYAGNKEISSTFVT